MTGEETKSLALALDALEAVRAWPEHAPAWWRLTSCVDPFSPELKQQVVAQVSQLHCPTAQAQWFKHCALHRVTGEREHLVRKAALANQLPDVERWMGLVTLVWWDALAQATDRHSFRQWFVDTGVPELLGTVGRERVGRSQPRASREGVRRVAILAQQLGSGMHAGTALTFNLRAQLEGAGIETGVFASQEMSLPSMTGFTACAYSSNMDSVEPGTWQLRTPGQVSVTVADARFSVSSRWNTLEQLIDDFAPDVVLFVGFFSPLVWSLQRRYPVVGMSLHTLPPICPVDVWLAAEAQTAADLAWPGFAAPQAVHFPFRFWRSAASCGASRSQIGVPDEAVLLVTSGWRLNSEITPDWCDEVLRRLEAQPQLHWLVIGLGGGDNALFSRQHARLHVLPRQADLAGWIALSDIYLNPPRFGGGASVALAMELGVCVAALAGSDGGAKIGGLAARSQVDYFQRVDQWVADSGARKRDGALLKDKFRDELDLSGAVARNRLAEACLQAKRCFENRQAPSELASAICTDAQA
jgi:hypothetical protein